MPVAWRDIFFDPAKWGLKRPSIDWQLAQGTDWAISNAIAQGEDLTVLRAPPGWAHQGSALDELILAADTHNLCSSMFANYELSSVTQLIAHGVPLVVAMATWTQQWQENPPSRNGFSRSSQSEI